MSGQVRKSRPASWLWAQTLGLVGAGRAVSQVLPWGGVAPGPRDLRDLATSPASPLAQVVLWWQVHAPTAEVPSAAALLAGKLRFAPPMLPLGIPRRATRRPEGLCCASPKLGRVVGLRRTGTSGGGEHWGAARRKALRLFESGCPRGRVSRTNVVHAWRGKAHCPMVQGGVSSPTNARCVRSAPDNCQMICAALMHGIRIADTPQDSLAEWSKALASGASPQGRGFEPHSCHCKEQWVAPPS